VRAFSQSHSHHPLTSPQPNLSMMFFSPVFTKLGNLLFSQW